MVNGISSLGTFSGATFRPEALQAYQQYLQQTQQANPQQTDRLIQPSNASLINPSGVAQAQNFATMVNNNPYQQFPYNDKYGNDIFAQQLFNNQTGQTYGNSGNYAQLNNSFVAGIYSGDIFAQQFEKSKPWEQICGQSAPQTNQTGYGYSQYPQYPQYPQGFSRLG